MDNYDLFLSHDAKQEEDLKRFPRCAECKQRITDEYVFAIDDGVICEQCLRDNHRKSIQDYMED